MNFIQYHLVQIIDAYEAPQPLNLFLKEYFKTNKKLGSRDRRTITEAVNLYYRLQKFYKNSPPLDIIKFGVENQHTNIQYLIDSFKDYPSSKIVPNDELLLPKFSIGVEQEHWKKDLLNPHQLFIRIHKNIQSNISKLENGNIHFKIINIEDNFPPIISLPIGTKLQEIIPEGDYVVQDLSSQRTLFQVKDYLSKQFNPQLIWDTCAGAGGKTLLAKCLWPMSKVISTDIRPSILNNLMQRAQLYQLKNISTMVADMSLYAPTKLATLPFDLIICDVPCSGSGTWARTPEQWAFFNQNTLEDFSERQFKIASNAISFLQSGKYFAYITCSVFAQENEDVVERLKSKNNIEVVFQNMITGFDYKSDHLFIALLKKV